MDLFISYIAIKNKQSIHKSMNKYINHKTVKKLTIKNPTLKRNGEISQIIIFNQNLYKNKSYFILVIKL